jgi:hypothetical protein
VRFPGIFQPKCRIRREWRAKALPSGDAKAAGTGAAGAGYDRKPPKTIAGCEVAMARCETCGNDYDKAFQVSMNGTTHTFDSFECAIHALAPTCENCGIRIVGHGLEKDGTFFCCEHCAEVIGVTGLAIASARRRERDRDLEQVILMVHAQPRRGCDMLPSPCGAWPTSVGPLWRSPA